MEDANEETEADAGSLTSEGAVDEEEKEMPNDALLGTATPDSAPRPGGAIAPDSALSSDAAAASGTSLGTQPERSGSPPPPSGTAPPPSGTPRPAGSASLPPPANPATLAQKVWLFVALILMTLIVVGFSKAAVANVDGYIQRENRVYWQAPAGFTLRPGPTKFWYDATQNQLVHVGIVDQKEKLDLIGLASAPVEQPPSADLKSYWAAIDQLAFVSNENLGGLLIGLLVLGGLAGVLGVQLRSLVNFVGHACYTNSLDVVIWWPYYALRPFTGFLLGTIIVVVVQAGFIAAGGGAPGGTLWWASVAFLAGFGEQEFTQRLRQLTKTLFGG
jgi:hypothetical protein